jgi:hypothetical protein
MSYLRLHSPRSYFAVLSIPVSRLHLSAECWNELRMEEWGVAVSSERNSGAPIGVPAYTHCPRCPALVVHSVSTFSM